MSPSANVQSIQAIEDFRTDLIRFGVDAGDALTAAETQIRHALEWLAERQEHWQRELRRRTDEAREAAAALARCRASGYVDKNGNYYAPDCSAYEAAHHRAEAGLREAEAELRTVKQ